LLEKAEVLHYCIRLFSKFSKYLLGQGFSQISGIKVIGNFEFWSYFNGKRDDFLRCREKVFKE